MGMHPMVPIPAQAPVQATRAQTGMHLMAPVPPQARAQATRAQMGMHTMPPAPAPAQIPVQGHQYNSNAAIGPSIDMPTALATRKAVSTSSDRLCPFLLYSLTFLFVFYTTVISI